MTQQKQRIHAAETALAAYEQARGTRLPTANDESLCNLLTDLRHYCAARDVDLETALRRSQLHFEAETEDET
jgi:hypothetical protein